MGLRNAELGACQVEVGLEPLMDDLVGGSRDVIGGSLYFLIGLPLLQLLLHLPFLGVGKDVVEFSLTFLGVLADLRLEGTILLGKVELLFLCFLLGSVGVLGGQGKSSGALSGLSLGPLDLENLL